MATKFLDTLGLRCPQPVLMIAQMLPQLKPGDILEVVGDCPTFEQDIRNWCKRMGKTLLSIKDEGEGKKRVQIQF